MDSNFFICPHCHSENVQSLPIIYHSNTSAGDSITQTGKIFSITKGVQMTNLARAVAPPVEKDTNWGLTAFFAFMTFVFFDMGNGCFFMMCLIATGYLFYQNNEANHYNKKILPEKYNIWSHSYFCHRCRNIFVRM